MKLGKYLTEDDIDECRKELFNRTGPMNIYSQKDFALAIEAKVIQCIHENSGFRWIEHAKQVSLLEE